VNSSALWVELGAMHYNRGMPEPHITSASNFLMSDKTEEGLRRVFGSGLSELEKGWNTGISATLEEGL
jgi:hypothetical protein